MLQMYSRKKMSRNSLNASVLETLVGGDGTLTVIHKIDIDKNLILFMAASAAGVLVINQIVKRI
jgi:hypothetical protein